MRMAKKAGIKLSADMSLLLKEIREAKSEFRKFNKDALDAASGLKPLEDQANRTGKRLGFLQRGVQGLSRVLNSGFARLTAGLGFGLWIKQMIGASSALTELDSKARVVFGSTFDFVERQTAAISDEVGRARSTILQFSADLGAIIQPMGIAAQRTAEMSTEFAKLAVDLASFHNTTDIQAFNALRSAITGELEPLKRFGVVMTQANLEVFAQTKGIKENITQMSQAQLTAVRYAYIMEQTAVAQGDAARTADSFANQTRRLQGEWQELNEELGSDLTGSLATGLGVLGDYLTSVLVPAIQTVRREFGNFLQMLNNAGSPIGSMIQGISDRWSIITGQAFEQTSAQRQLTIEDVRASVAAGSNQPLSQQAVRDFQLQQDYAAGAGVGASDPSSGGKKAEKTRDEIEKFYKEMLKNRRDELKLRKEMGVITRREERQLDRINDMTEFQSDVIKDATDEWQKQVKALEAVEDKIESINEKIEDEEKRLQERLIDIEKDASDQRVDIYRDMLQEQKRLQEKLIHNEGLDGREQKRLAELDDLVSSVQTDEANIRIRIEELQGQLKQFEAIGERRKHTTVEFFEIDRINKELQDLRPQLGLAGDLERARQFEEADPFEQIEMLKNERIKAEEEEAEARLKPLRDELHEAEKNKREIERMEQEKKQAVITALNERKTVTQQTYATLEVSLKEHVDKQVAELARYKSAVMSLTALETFGMGEFQNQAVSGVFEAGKTSVLAGNRRNRARGGAVFGPGGPTSDSIPAWLSNGEFVVNAAATQRFRPLLEKINAQTVPVQKFASGGAVTHHNERSANVTINNHGRAAEVSAHPRMAKWIKRTLL